MHSTSVPVRKNCLLQTRTGSVCTWQALVVVMGLFLTSTGAFAHSKHTANLCSAADATACLHIGYNDDFTTSAASEFMVHFMVQPTKNDKLSVQLIELWMPSMGHGSSPVTVTQKSPVHFKVSDANFVMAGDWVVRVKFDWKGVAHTIEVPFNVKDAAPLR